MVITFIQSRQILSKQCRPNSGSALFANSLIKYALIGQMDLPNLETSVQGKCGNDKIMYAC